MDGLEVDYHRLLREHSAFAPQTASHAALRATAQMLEELIPDAAACAVFNRAAIRPNMQQPGPCTIIGNLELLLQLPVHLDAPQRRVTLLSIAVRHDGLLQVHPAEKEN